MELRRRKGQKTLAMAVAVGAAACLGRTALALDYYVDTTYGGANGAAYTVNGKTYAGAYNSVSAALGAGGVGNGSSALNPNRVYFAAGTYNVGTSSLAVSTRNLALIGLTNNPNDVVITSTLDAAYNGGSTTLGTTNCSTIQLKGNNVSAANITFANSTDTPYIVNNAHAAVTPSGTYTGNAQTSTAPAVALLLQGDEQVLNNVKVLGYQDSLYMKGGRVLITNSYISGDNDFIFANSTVVISNSIINMDGDHIGGAVTAASTDKRTSNGFVFLNDTIQTSSAKGSIIDPLNAANANGAAVNSMYLGRPWGWQQAGGDASTVLVNNKITSAIKTVGWLAWNSNETNVSNGKNGGNPAEDSRYAEYNSMDLSGATLDVSGRVIWSHQLNATQAAAYTTLNVFSSEYNASTNPGGYAWYDGGYPSGDNAAGSGLADINPSYSWPAFWGPRNIQNDGAGNSAITGNPAAYSDPTWTLGGNWDPTAQLATIPEPASLGLLGGAMAIILCRRRDKSPKVR